MATIRSWMFLQVSFSGMVVWVFIVGILANYLRIYLHRHFDFMIVKAHLITGYVATMNVKIM